jgi:hypothetical protein
MVFHLVMAALGSVGSAVVAPAGMNSAALHMFDQATYSTARCLDGSPFGAYIRPSPLNASVSSKSSFLVTTHRTLSPTVPHTNGHTGPSLGTQFIEAHGGGAKSFFGGLLQCGVCGCGCACGCACVWVGVVHWCMCGAGQCHSRVCRMNTARCETLKR